MRIDHERKSMDVEQRDIDYLLPAYVRLYLFQNKNEDPSTITFPMFRSVPHPYKKGVVIPIEYVPDTSPVAVEIKQDGADVPEATPETEAVADKKEADYDAMKARLAKLEAELAKARATTSEDLVQEEADKELEEDTAPVSPAKAAFAEQHKPASAIAGMSPDQPTPERLAKAKEAPGGTLPPGTPTDYGGNRDPRDFKRIAKDLMPEKDIKEEDEKPDNSFVERAKKKGK